MVQAIFISLDSVSMQFTLRKPCRPHNYTCEPQLWTVTTFMHLQTLGLLCGDHNMLILCRSDGIDLEKEFEQNELNSVVYLISMAMQISNFAVNYKVSWSVS